MKFSLTALIALLRNPATRAIAKKLIFDNFDTLVDLGLHYLDLMDDAQKTKGG